MPINLLKNQAISKREQLINSASSLFKRNGINNTGVELIVKTANVSKKTLYSHFKTKEELLLATLRKNDELGRNALMHFAEEASDKPKQQILAIFDFYQMWFETDQFNGCLFSNSAAEIADKASSGRRICAEHKLLIENYIEKLANKAKAVAPKELAWQINLLLEGAIVMAFVVGDTNAATKAKQMATVFLNEQRPK